MLSRPQGLVWLDVFFLFEYWGVSPYWVHSALRPLLPYCTCPGWLWGWRSWWNTRFWQGKLKYSEKNLPRRHFVNHKSHLPNPGATPGHRGGKPATNRFSYGAAPVIPYNGPRPLYSYLNHHPRLYIRCRVLKAFKIKQNDVYIWKCLLHTRLCSQINKKQNNIFLYTQ
jgi:hypothetical protein